MYRDVHAQLREERRKNEKLEAENRKLQGDLAYVAMMTDVDLDDGEEETNHE
jgi:cell division protein FtsB